MRLMSMKNWLKFSMFVFSCVVLCVASLPPANAGCPGDYCEAGAIAIEPAAL